MNELKNSMVEITREVKCLEDEVIKLLISEMGCENIIDVLEDNSDATQMFIRGLKLIDKMMDALILGTEYIEFIKNGIEEETNLITKLNSKLDKLGK